MQSAERAARSGRVLLESYNAAVNVFWSLLAFIPVSVFCYQYMDRRWLYRFIAVSLLVYAVPASVLRRLELSSRPAPYRRLGVHWANRFVQHGTFINGLLRRRYPEYRRVRSRIATAQLVRGTYYQERFHWAAFLLFLLAGIYAIAHGHPGWAFVITLMNVLYNLYPIWLQQYIRMRARRTHSRALTLET